MKKTLYLFCALSIAFSSFSQQGDGGIPRSNSISNQVDHRLFSTPDIQVLKAEDLVTDIQKSGPWRFGFNNDTDLNFTNSGTWMNLSNGGQLWQLQVSCENALTVNLTFENLKIPAGNELYVFNPEKTFILGKFRSIGNRIGSRRRCNRRVLCCSRKYLKG